MKLYARSKTRTTRNPADRKRLHQDPQTLKVLSPDPPETRLDGIQRMWDGGPLRQFSSSQVASHYIRYSSPILTGMAGAYVCDRCLHPSAGVHFVRHSDNWLCAACKKRTQRVRRSGKFDFAVDTKQSQVHLTTV